MVTKEGELAMRNSVMVTVVLVILSFSGSVFGQTASVTSETWPTEPWNDKIKGDVDEAVRLYADDPVSSLLTFKSVMDRGTDGPTQTQKVWLSTKVESLRTRALKTLQTDFDQSTRANDLRTALIASTVADKIGKESIKTQPAMTGLKNKVFAGSRDVTSVWAVSNVVGRFIEVPYSEGVSFSRFTLTPKQGFHLLRVTAFVRNTSPLADKSYTLWATEDVKRSLAQLNAKPDEHKPPYLWLDGSFVFLLTPASDLVPCSHVCDGCGLHGTLSFTVSEKDGTGRAITVPQIIDSGKKLDIDLLFSVPKGITDYRLLVLGSTPIKLKIIPTGASLK
ncbi:MAG: hypothetical protein HY879_18035 [Deltaproteobacteria bacterium]|nr:hypothetical protein [Deltaproteobacteria bacterium]